MDKYDAAKQLCKMQGEIASRLGLETVCTCDEEIVMYGEVPDKVIEEMWRRLTDPHWSEEKPFTGVSCQHCGSSRLIKKEGDELFLPQTGCLNCNRWLTPVRLRKP